MKRAVTILLILVMSLHGFYKLGVLTYFEVNRSYIAKVLCINKDEPVQQCNGHCYLKRNLQKAEEPSNSPVPPSKEKFEMVIFVSDKPSYNFKTYPYPNAGNTAWLNKLQQGVKDPVFHPPLISSSC